MIDRNKNYRITIRCNKATYHDWRVMVADSGLDNADFLTKLMENYRLNTPGPGTTLPTPGPTFGQMFAGRP